MNKSILLAACLCMATGARAQTASLWFSIDNATGGDLRITDADAAATVGRLYIMAGEAAPGSFRGCQKLANPGDRAILKPGKNWVYCDTSLAGLFAMNFKIRDTTFNIKFAKAGTVISKPWLSVFGEPRDMLWSVDQRGFLKADGPVWLTIH
ncbi:MAG TPA: hypothetical protein VK188_12045 [Holophaga sp.]|nr:hypothetical protein [Holophaga sp.]